MTNVDKKLEKSYKFCRELTTSHYENFTVASILIPKSKRNHIYAIYAYCRMVDDIGDEPSSDFAFLTDLNVECPWQELSESERRLALLEYWESQLTLCYTGIPTNPVMYALQDTIRSFEIPITPFIKLIVANRLDQNQRRYETFEDLLNYCEYSANPVGHIFLSLFGYGDDLRHKYSDFTCTGLQLVNFLQDIKEDFLKGRIYIPQEDMSYFGYTEDELDKNIENTNFQRLIEFETGRAHQYLNQGYKLIDYLDGPIRLDVALFNRGGAAVLKAIVQSEYTVLMNRPKLSKYDSLRLVLVNLLKYLVRRDASSYMKGNV